MSQRIVGQGVGTGRGPSTAPGTKPPGPGAAFRDANRLFAWARRHPTLIDVGWAGLLGLLAASTAAFAADARLSGPLWLTPIVHGIPVVAIVWRRRYPVAVFATIAAAGFVQWAAQIHISWTQVCLLVALYTVAERGEPRWRRAALAVAVLGIALALLLPRMLTTGNAILGLAVVFCTYLIGTNVGLRRDYLAGLEERAARLELERDQRARIAVADERTRIARELHDVVAHNVSVVVLQADGALWSLDGDPERARTAVATIADTGRTTLAEMRRLLGVLRDDHGAALAPQPGFGSLADLVAGVRASGLAVEVVIDTNDGRPDDPAAPASDVPQGLQLAVYRIVQEGLTNVLKHAGPAASARVVIAREPDAVVVEIVDDGLGPRPSPDGDGHGLIGMRERAALFGGQVRTGGRPDGGFAVHARLPVPVSERDLAVDARR